MVKKYYIRTMGMEDETREFLVRIMQTISWVLLWMMVNVFIGIYKGFGFFNGDGPHWPNWLYYLFLVSSLVALVWHLRKKWKL